jgi:hypothetical protein
MDLLGLTLVGFLTRICSWLAVLALFVLWLVLVSFGWYWLPWSPLRALVAQVGFGRLLLDFGNLSVGLGWSRVAWLAWFVILIILDWHWLVLVGFGWLG